MQVHNNVGTVTQSCVAQEMDRYAKRLRSSAVAVVTIRLVDSPYHQGNKASHKEGFEININDNILH